MVCRLLLPIVRQGGAWGLGLSAALKARLECRLECRRSIRLACSALLRTTVRRRENREGWKWDKNRDNLEELRAGRVKKATVGSGIKRWL